MPSLATPSRTNVGCNSTCLPQQPLSQCRRPACLPHAPSSCCRVARLRRAGRRRDEVQPLPRCGGRTRALLRRLQQHNRRGPGPQRLVPAERVATAAVCVLTRDPHALPAQRVRMRRLECLETPMHGPHSLALLLRRPGTPVCAFAPSALPLAER